MGIANCKDCGKPLVGIHTCTPKRWKEWVGLTDKDIQYLQDVYDVASDDYARAIEAKLKENNA